MPYRPDHLRILGITSLPVSWTSPEEDEDMWVTEPDGIKYPISGYYLPTSGTLHINKDIPHPLRTLVHELIHAYYRHMFEPRTEVNEEMACRLMETAIADLCQNNWELMKALHKEDAYG